MDNEEYVILLRVVEGVGLGLTGENVIITASLGGTKLETEVVTPGTTNTYFHNNLIWETDKKSIKRMKTENLPIKVEAFTCHVIKGQEVRNLIGYILIPIRGVPIVRKVVNIRPHWYKLIGLNSDWKMNKPELSVFLTITDKNNFVQNGISNKNPSVEEGSEASMMMHPKTTAEMLKSQQGLFIQLLQEEGLLQVGDLKSDCDIFIVRVTFKNAKHLEHIINAEERTNLTFRIHYSLLGAPSFCDLEPKENGVYNIQEKIAINFRTSVTSLNEYLNKVFILPVDVYYSASVVGHANIRFTNLLNSGDFKNIGDSFETEGTIPIETIYDLHPTAPKPFIEYVFNVKYMSSTKVSSCEVIHYKPHVVEYRDNQAGGDGGSLQGVELPPTEGAELKEPSRDLRPVQSDSILDTQEDIEGRVPKPARSNPVIKRTSEKLNMDELLMDKGYAKTSRDAPRAFSFTLYLQMVKFTRRPEIGIWQISLHHAKADTPYTMANVELSEICTNVIEFNNLELQLVFASTADEILNLVESESCILNINGPRGMHATADIDNEVLLVSTKEKHSGVILLENQSGEKVGMAHIYVCLDDLGISFNTQIKNRINNAVAPQKPYLDEDLAYKVVEELEEWKYNQQDIFLVELKRKEINHLALLSVEWQKKRLEQETKLAEKLRECTALAETLEIANKEIQEKGLNKIEQERLMEQVKSEMEAQFSIKLLDINEKSRRIEEDLTHKLNLEQLRYKELEINKTSLERENQKLKAEIAELSEKLGEMRKTFLPKEQLAGLFQDVRILSERLEEVQKSKIFYKDQWAQTIREVHKMKAENLRQIELKLKQCRNMRLDDILENEQSELSSEKRELTAIQEVLETDDENIDEETLLHQCLLKCANN